MSLRKLSEDYDKKLTQNFERVSQIYEKQRKKEHEVLANLKFTIEQRKSPAKKFNIKQKEITQAMRLKNQSFEKQALQHWKKDLVEVENRLRRASNEEKHYDGDGGMHSGKRLSQ